MISFDILKKLNSSDGDMVLELKANIKTGEFIALSGKSGSGKTTFLRILAGLERTKANIIVDNEIWQNENIFLPPQKRQIGFVFQDYALFENMNVEQNLLFVKNDVKLATHLLQATELEKLKKQNVTTLSGGQKQRVSLCRALMNRPKILLLDEPLSALDNEIRTKLQDKILELHKEFKTTTIIVSHDPREIYKLSNRIMVLQSGQISKFGTPTETLLKMNGSQKFSFDAEILDIKKIDAIFIAIVAVESQISEIVIDEEEACELKIGQKVRVGTKAFSPNITLA